MVQANSFNPTHASVTICPITTTCIDAPLFRVNLPPGERTGLKSASQVMVDKIVSVPRASIVREVGRCDEATSHAVEDALRNWLSLSPNRSRD